MKKSFKNYIKLLVLGFASIAQGGVSNAMNKPSKTAYGNVYFNNSRKNNITFNNFRKKSASKQNLNKINPENQNDENQKELSDNKSNKSSLKNNLNNIFDAEDYFPGLNSSRLKWFDNNCELCSILHILQNPIMLNEIRNKPDEERNILEKMVFEISEKQPDGKILDISSLEISKQHGEQPYIGQNNSTHYYKTKYFEVKNNAKEFFHLMFLKDSSLLRRDVETALDKNGNMLPAPQGYKCIGKLFGGYKVGGNGKLYEHVFCAIPLYEESGELSCAIVMNDNPGNEPYYFKITAQEFESGTIKQKVHGLNMDYGASEELFAKKEDFDKYSKFWSEDVFDPNSGRSVNNVINTGFINQNIDNQFRTAQNNRLALNSSKVNKESVPGTLNNVNTQNGNKINYENQKESHDNMRNKINDLKPPLQLKASALNLYQTQTFKNFNATRFIWSDNNCKLSAILHALSNPIALRDIKNKQEKNLPLNILEEMILELANVPPSNYISLMQLKVSKSEGTNQYYYKNDPHKLHFNYPNKYVEVTNNLDSIFKSTFNPGNSSLQLVAPTEEPRNRSDVCIAKLFSGDLHKNGNHYAHSFCVIPVYNGNTLIGGLAMNSNPSFKEYYYFVVSAEEFKKGYIKTPFLNTAKEYAAVDELYVSKKDFEEYSDFWSLGKVNSILHPYRWEVLTDNRGNMKNLVEL